MRIETSGTCMAPAFESREIPAVKFRGSPLNRADTAVTPSPARSLTGEWLARANKIRKKTFYGRGDHYNHSGYADLAITGLAGLRPRADSVIEVNPVAPAAWDWFCLDGVLYHGRILSVIWDKTGGKFGKGKGLRLLAGGTEIARSLELTRIAHSLPGAR